MADTTLTFSTLSGQTTVQLVDDPTKPGWNDVLASDLGSKDESDEKPRKQARRQGSD